MDLESHPLEAKADHICSRLFSRPEVHNPTLVNDHDLLKLLIDPFPGLVNTDEGTHFLNIGEEAKGFGVI